MYKYFGDILSDQFKKDLLKTDKGANVIANDNPEKIRIDKDKKIKDFLNRCKKELKNV